jgi:hypothetical protein
MPRYLNTNEVQTLIGEVDTPLEALLKVGRVGKVKPVGGYFHRQAPTDHRQLIKVARKPSRKPNLGEALGLMGVEHSVRRYAPCRSVFHQTNIAVLKAAQKHRHGLIGWRKLQVASR